MFYCTPQTLLNDIRNGLVDATQIVCVVVDEAHRASGNYAYVQVVSQIERRNRHFRVLALSATPGSSMEKVQEVVHKLHITHLEVRNDEDPDVKKYINSRIEEIVEVGTARAGKLEPLRVDFFNAAMRPLLAKLQRAQAFHAKITSNITRGSIYQAYQSWKIGGGNGNNNDWGSGQLSINGVHGAFGALLSLAMANDLLRDHGIGGFYKQLKRFENDPKSRKAGNPRREIVSGPEWSALVQKTERMQASGQHVHPKLRALYSVLREHFDRYDQGGRASGAGTRVIVFAQFRNSVTGIVQFLEGKEEQRVAGEDARIALAREEGREIGRRRVRIRSHKFVGQSNGAASSSTGAGKGGASTSSSRPKPKPKPKRKKKKKMTAAAAKRGPYYDEKNDSDAEGFVDPSAVEQAAAAAAAAESAEKANADDDRGMNQKKQESVVQGFKDGTFNVLVSTSIGEEGLDIGQVDRKCFWVLCF